jgi:hypothetical protein
MLVEACNAVRCDVGLVTALKVMALTKLLDPTLGIRPFRRSGAISVGACVCELTRLSVCC